jgi:hypothetical protein
MAKGLHSWTVQESSAPVTTAEIKDGDGTTTVSFSQTTRAIMGLTAATGSGTLTVTLGAGGTIVIPNAAINSVFAPGSIVPFACDSFVFSASESAFQVIGLL